MGKIKKNFVNGGVNNNKNKTKVSKSGSVEDLSIRIRDLAWVPESQKTKHVPKNIDLETPAMAGSESTIAGDQVGNGKPKDPVNQTKQSSKGSILTPERLLEGLVDFPSLFSWDVKVTIPGHMTMDALMKIGLVYSFVGMIMKIDGALRKIILVNALYTNILKVFCGIFLSVAIIFRSIARAFNYAVQLVPIKAFRHMVSCAESGTLRFLNRQDTYIAFRIKEYLWTHPRAQETFSELIDDLLHWLLKSSCKSAHPNSTLPRGEQIDKAFEGLSKKSFEVETN